MKANKGDNQTTPTLVSTNSSNQVVTNLAVSAQIQNSITSTWFKPVVSLYTNFERHLRCQCFSDFTW